MVLPSGHTGTLGCLLPTVLQGSQCCQGILGSALFDSLHFLSAVSTAEGDCEEQEWRADEEAMPRMNISSSPNEAVMPPPYTVDDLNNFRF